MKNFNNSTTTKRNAFYVISFIFFVLLSAEILLPIPLNAANTKFQNIDRYARFTPEEFEKSVEILARYLMDGAENDVEKVRAFYVWIADNISYDTKSYFRRQYPNQSPQAVLNRRTAICQGYANLFKRFCDIANFPCIIISGFSRGYGTNPAIIPEEDNHVWNAVQVDDQWHLIDVTWGSGYIDEKRKFVKRFSGFYFFPDPAELIFTHFPSNHNYQLLLISKTKEEFLNQMLKKPEWFKYGLKAVSHKKSRIITEQPVTIYIKAPPEVELSAELNRSDETLPDRYHFVQEKDSLTEISLIFPANDVFILTIFAKNKADSGLFNSVGEYWIDVRNIEKPQSTFPMPYKTFYSQGCYLFDPLKSAEKIKEGKPIKILAPHAEKAAIVLNKRWTYFEKADGDIFTGLIPNNGEDIILYALFPGDTKFQALLNFTANTR
jgi:hypothetical protein